MKQEPNNDIDNLLRKLGRKQSAIVDRADYRELASDHLDADELNAYAEQALPANVRARYTEHLVDCNTCRRVVTELSFSSAPVAAEERVNEGPVSGWKTALATLLSPFVVRYAIPTLAVVMLAAIVWVFVARKPELEQMASNTGSRAPEPAVQTQPPADEPPQASPPKTQELKQLKDSGQQPAKSSQEAQGTEATAKGVDEIRESQEREEVAKRDQPQPKAPEPPAAAGNVAAAPGATDVDRSRVEALKKAEGQTAKVQAAVQQEQRAYEAGRSGPSQTQQAPREAGARTRQSALELSRQRADRNEAKEKDQASDEIAEVRTIAGRRFIRRESMWIDSLYRAGQATVNVRRGSEQYRALIGDEPGLKPIVEQLSGEIIVVWKGRAYRFR